MKKSYDLKGKMFGDLEVLGIDTEEMERRKENDICYGTYWKCKCHACGGYRTTTTGKLMSGSATHCGCQKNQNAKKHGLSNAQGYKIWSEMKQKCYNPENKSYNLYGAKGITVCKKWYDSFEAFYIWLLLQTGGSPCYLYLKDNAKEFSPENCIVDIKSELFSPNLKTLPKQMFGKLKPVKYLEAKNIFGKYEYFWECKCECGNTVIVKESTLLNHSKTSCGCNLEPFKTVENFSSKCIKLHSIIQKMRSRCYDPASNKYQYYGARGIKICDEWKYDDEKFIIWGLCTGYNFGLTIERENNNKDYCPENCRWIPFSKQASNTSSNVYFKIGNVVHYLTEWSKLLNLKTSTGKPLSSVDVIKKKLTELGGFEVPNPNLYK